MANEIAPETQDMEGKIKFNTQPDINQRITLDRGCQQYEYPYVF
jgi:hypothetical protein